MTAEAVGIIVGVFVAWLTSLGTVLILYVKNNNRHQVELSSISERLATIVERIVGIQTKCVEHGKESVRMWGRIDNHETRLVKLETTGSNRNQRDEVE